VSAQYKQDSILKDTALLRMYGARLYDMDYCDCPQAEVIPGRPETYPKGTPYYKFLSDTSLWEWVPLNIEGIDQKAIYDLKPQYKDTLVRNDGSVVEVPIWIKYPDWKKDK
jgi:hypothetical protein